jgi:hypothetical protein
VCVCVCMSKKDFNFLESLFLQAKKEWNAIHLLKINIFGCYSTENIKPIAEQNLSYTMLDNAVYNLITGVEKSNEKTILTMCKMRDHIQMAKNVSTMPLVMFYFPHAYKKMRSNDYLTNNTKSTLENLNNIYYSNSNLDTKIQLFIQFLDKTGTFFRDIYYDNIDELRDGRYSFLYEPFVSTQIQYELETKPLKFNFWVDTNDRITFANCTKDECTELVQLFLLLKRLYPTANNYNYDIKFLLTDVPKLLPKPGEYLTPQNVNSGYTIIYPTNLRKILIYRREEYIKVFIHEFLHSVGCDRDVAEDTKIVSFLSSLKTETTPIFGNTVINMNDIKDIAEIKKNKKIHNNPNETLAEIGSNILMIIFRLLQNNQPFEIFYSSFERERQFALNQCAKIIQHFGGDDVKNTIIKQTTNVIPYYILRASIYFQPEKLFEYLNKNGNICYILPIKKEITELLRSVGFTSFSPEFVSEIKKLISQKKFDQSMRMTYFG